MRSGKINRLNPGWLYRLLLPVLLLVELAPAKAQIASFSFAGPDAATGWTNVSGDPHLGTQTATAGGITLSSISPANWSPNSNNNCAVNSFGVTSGTYFPAAVMSNSWIQYNGTNNNLALYNALLPQIALSGLNRDSTYILRMTGSNVYYQGATQYTVAGGSVAGSQNLTTYNNSSQGITFERVAPDSNGVIRVFVNCPGGLSGTSFAWICGLQVYSGSANIRTPQVAISAPANGAIQPEGGNVAINATASESGGSIVKVEFYEDTTKIGEVDTAPYNFTWLGPEPGNYLVTATATDNVGTINTASVSIAVESLNYFWSTTGNAGNNADGNFVGNVDSVRLDFRTKDIQRMSILATGNVGIGTIVPTAQLHTTGSVRLGGIGHDSMGADQRILVSDSNGNLAYRDPGNSGSGLGETASGALALGDSISGPGLHSFSSNRYQYLSGYQYSIGGSVNDPVKNPNFRIYDNGNISAGNTMDTTVHLSTGMQYYSKTDILQLGGSDSVYKLRNNIVNGSAQSSAFLINSEGINSYQNFSGFTNTALAGSSNSLVSSGSLNNCIIASNFDGFASQVSNSIMAGSSAIGAGTQGSIICGQVNSTEFFVNSSYINGFFVYALDTVQGSIISGPEIRFGGPSQLVVGDITPFVTPYGTSLGGGGVSFSSTPTGTKGTNTPGVDSLPIFDIGIGSTNAITVLYNGRTQINTIDSASNHTETAVKPKAALEVVSSNSGVLLPKLTTMQRNAIAAVDLQNGLLLYNTDSGVYQFYNGSAWSDMGAAVGAGSAGWSVSGNTSTNPSSNFVGTTDAEAAVFGTDDTARMTVLANGAVGIGTSALPGSDAQLAVNGTVYAKKIKVTLTGWPDYVFGKNYVLPTLPSLARYIRQRRHLPGIPSLREVEEKGVDLGDNEAILLKKIEELTLYLIEEHKRTVARQEEIEQLKVENRTMDDHQREIDQLKEMVKQLAARNKNELHK